MHSKMQEILFYFQVRKDQSSVAQGSKIRLLMSCKLLGISKHLGQAVKAALLCRDKAATKILSTVAEAKYPGMEASSSSCGNKEDVSC